MSRVLTPQDFTRRTGAGFAYGGAAYRRLGSTPPPEVTGFAFPGEELTSSAAGQWYRDDVAISGETGDAYTVGVRDIGAALRCGDSEPVTVWHPADVPQALDSFLPGRSTLTSVEPNTPATDDKSVRFWGGVEWVLKVEQTSLTDQPVFSANDPAPGLSAVSFNGSSHRLTFTDGTSAAERTKAFTGQNYFGVCIAFQDSNRTGGTSQHNLFGITDQGGNQRMTVQTKNSSSYVFRAVSRITDGGTLISTEVNSQDGWHVLFVEHDGFAAKLNMYLDGVLVASEDSSVGVSSASEGRGGLGWNTGSLNLFPGSIAFCVLFQSTSAAIGSVDRNRLQQYAGRCAGLDLGLLLS